LKFARFILCGFAALAFPALASAQDAATPAAVESRHASTLFPGILDMPVAEGSNVPSSCEFPESLTASGLELACVVAEDGVAENEVGIEYISWLGDHGWRHSANIIGGFAAARETSDGCDQTLNIYPHGDEDEPSGIWFALAPQHCAGRQETP
jgi:hypothetical protein